MYNELKNQSKGWPRISVFAANAVYLSAAVGLIALRFVSGSLYAGLVALFPAISYECAVLVINCLYYLFFLGMPVMLAAGGRAGMGGCMRLRGFSVWKGVLIALAALVGVPVSSYIASFWAMALQQLGLDPFATETLLGAESPVGLLFCLISTAVLPALFEELGFRGAVLPAYENRGTIRAVLISALLFTSLHASFVGFPTQLLLGIVMGSLVVVTGSLWSGVLYHAVHNGLTAVIAYVQENNISGQAAQTGDLFAYFGGAKGVAAYAAIGALMLVIYLAILYPVFQKKHRAAHPQADASRSRMTGAELLVLSAGIVSVIALYAEDLLKMMGILQ